MKKIFLSNGNFTLVSDEDFLYLSGYNWSLSNGYAIAWVSGRLQFINRVIAERMGLDLLKGEVDHIDRDPLNNVRENLRLATRSQNQSNSIKRKDNTSGYKGVSWHKRDQKWTATISVNGRKIWLGYFDSLKEARQVYIEAAKHYYGEFSNP